MGLLLRSTVSVAFLVTAPTVASATAFLPDFGSATFTGAAPDNPFFPLPEGVTRTFEALEGGEVVEAFQLTNLGLGPTILGVQTFVQRDRSFEEGVLVEDTFDYYAQDTAGNVWYFGEDVTNFIYDEEGNLIGTTTEGAWRAGVNGALPGFIMPVDHTIGFNYKQEFAPADDAIDEGTISAVGLSIDDFTDVLRVLETNPLEPDSREFKFYAPGFGLIRAEEGLDEGLENPELVFRLAEVPEPPALALFGLGLAGLACLGRSRSRR